MSDRPDATTLSPTAIPDRDIIRRSLIGGFDARIACAGRAGDYSSTTPGSELAGDGEVAVRTPARDAYLEARAQAGTVGVALADPRMRRALILDRLQQDHARIASSLREGYDASRKPAAWRRRDRSEWKRHQETARDLVANAEWQEQIRAELGPNSESLTRQALALADAREHILAQTTELHRNAIDEELAREPEWLIETLGPCPEQGAGRWQTLAGQLAANRMRFLVVDDADPGIRPEQSHLAQQVAQFQAEAALAQSVSLTPGVGLGM